MPAAGLALADLLGHLGQIVRDLRDENGVGGAGDARVQGDPAGIAAHHLHHHDAMVRLGSGVEPVDALGGERDRGVEAERDDRLVQVVVDGLGHPDDFEPLADQLHRDGQRTVAADGHQGVDLLPAEVVDDLAGAVHLVELTVGARNRVLGGIAPVGGAQDRAAQVGDPAHRVGGQPDHAAVRVLLRTENAVVAVTDAPHLPAAVERGDDRRADHRVETGRVAAARVDGDLSDPGSSHDHLQPRVLAELRTGCVYSTTRRSPRRKSGLLVIVIVIRNRNS